MFHINKIIVPLPKVYSAHEKVKKNDEEFIEQTGGGEVELNQKEDLKRKIESLDGPLLHSLQHPLIKTETILLSKGPAKKPKLEVKKSDQKGSGLHKIKHKLQFI